MKDIQDLSLSASNIQVDPKGSAPDLIAATMILNQGFDSNENRSSQYKIQPPREPFSLRQEKEADEGADYSLDSQ